ncbi:MAG: dephospho-CoA kinase [Bdellovibrionales bacterium]|nr:dephospho-CoA kinase [Bdellovibrionales bacterium]
MLYIFFFSDDLFGEELAELKSGGTKLKWIGLTGGLGSGKSLAGRIWRNLGFPVLDADTIAQAVVGPGTEGHRQIETYFGTGVLNPDRTIDRAKLASIVFQDAVALRHLEQITHPRVRNWVTTERELWSARGFKLCFYDVPLLYEKKMEADFDKVVVVDATKDLRLARAGKRSGMSAADFQRREGFQIPLTEKVARADFVLQNEGTLEELETQVRNITSVLLGP